MHLARNGSNNAVQFDLNGLDRLDDALAPVARRALLEPHDDEGELADVPLLAEEDAALDGDDVLAVAAALARGQVPRLVDLDGVLDDFRGRVHRVELFATPCVVDVLGALREHPLEHVAVDPLQTNELLGVAVLPVEIVHQNLVRHHALALELPALGRVDLKEARAELAPVHEDLP